MSLFASTSITTHVARGAGAAGLSLLAALLLRSETLPGAIGGMAAIGGALLLLRGCPMCWTIGLIETIAARIGRTTGSHSEDNGR